MIKLNGQMDIHYLTFAKFKFWVWFINKLINNKGAVNLSTSLNNVCTHALHGTDLN